MNAEDRLNACKMRLRGASIRRVATEVGVTFQAVHTFLQKSPHREDGTAEEALSASAVLETYGESKVYEVFQCFADGMLDAAEIARTTGLAESDIFDIFSSINARKARTMESDLYPAVTAWMRDHRYDLQEMADLLHVVPPTLSAVLRGHRHMTESITRRISQVTGLSVLEINKELIRADKDSIRQLALDAASRYRMVNGNLNDPVLTRVYQETDDDQLCRMVDSMLSKVSCDDSDSEKGA